VLNKLSGAFQWRSMQLCCQTRVDCQLHFK